MELRQYFISVFRWWWLILLSTVLAAGVSYYASSKQPRIYQTTTTLIVGQVIQKANPTGQDFATLEQLAESYAQMARLQPILQAAVDSLALDMSWQDLQWRVNAYSVPRTQLLAVTVQDVSPERAVAIADQVAHELILQSPSSPENKERQQRRIFIQNQADELEKRITASETQLKDLEAKLAVALSAREIQSLQTEINSLRTLVDGWRRDHLELLNYMTGGGDPNYLSIIEPAQLNYTPVSPDVKMNVLLAAAVGFMLAVSAALVLEYLDDTVKSTDDLSSALNLMILGSVGRLKGQSYKEKLITAHGPLSLVAEAYRLVRTNIQFMAVDQPAKSIMITSSNPGEGKSLTVANLAMIMAQANLRTIIVDADLRQPVIHKIFQLPNLEGVSDLLRSSKLEVADLLKETGIENLKVLTSGPLPPNAAEILGSRRMAELVQRLEEMADVVIFDSSPVLAVTDAAILSNWVDGVILIAQAKRTRREAARQAIKRLNQVGANFLGGILNQAPGRGESYQASSYYTHSNRAGLLSVSKQRRWWQRLPVFK
jgi:polysaccharide biosynthesis transport protein